VALATAEAIRDQCYSLLEALTPTTDATGFRRYRNEGGADFVEWAEQNPSAALRRFQVREVDEDGEPLVTDTTEERVRMFLEIRIAYPQTHRYGAGNAMDRDDVAKQDWKQIKQAIGINGRANFSGSYDCTPLGAVRVREEGGSVDFSLITAEFEYQRSTA
jgi:hypothetical protein